MPNQPENRAPQPVVPFYLFSLPRSGSTLAQRILAGHREISTSPEPWLLLPFLYALKPAGVYAEYRHDRMTQALEDFIRTLPEGRLDYESELREFLIRIYGKAAGGRGTYFLDKTPRYDLVAGDIIRLFPEGKFIFLWRNPLAIISSMMETWEKGKWNLFLFKVDLFDGLAHMVEAFERNQNRACSVRYEDLVSRPEAEWKRIFDYLRLPYDEGLLTGFNEVRLESRMGDPTGARQYTTISTDPLDKWKRTLGNPLRKAWSRRYLRWIGGSRLASMGYDLDELLAELDRAPSGMRYLVSDLVRMAAGTAYCLFEPRMIRRKLGQLRQWHRIHAHS